MRHVIVYRPPYTSLRPVSTSAFFDELSQLLENAVMWHEALVISGDLNLHLDDLRDNHTKKCMDLLEMFSLSQNVSGPTRLSGHTLDLLLVREMIFFLLPRKLLFPSSIILLFSVLWASHNQLCHTKN